MSKEFELFLKSCPQAGKAYMELFRSVSKGPALDARTTQLILIAVMTAQNYPPGVRAHVPQALKAGATVEDISEAIITTLPVSGINGVLECLPVALEAAGEVAG